MKTNYILNSINKKKYFVIKNNISQITNDENNQKIILELIKYLEKPYQLIDSNYLEKYLLIKDIEYEDLDKIVIKALLKQIFDINRFNTVNKNVIMENILEFGLNIDDLNLLEEDYILEILEVKKQLKGNSIKDLIYHFDIYYPNPFDDFKFAMQYGDYLKALELLDTNFYYSLKDKNEIRKYEFIKCLLNNLLSNEEFKSKEEIKKEKYLSKKMKKLNNLDKYVSGEYFVRAMRYYKEQKRFVDEEDNLFYETMFKYGISCLKYEYEIVKDDNSDEVKRLIKKLEIDKK